MTSFSEEELGMLSVGVEIVVGCVGGGDGLLVAGGGEGGWLRAIVVSAWLPRFF